MSKLLTLGMTIAGCLLAAYFLWVPNAVELAEDEQHPNDDFLPFSNELIIANDIGIEKASTGTLKQRVRAPAQIEIIPDQMAHILPKVSGIAVAAYKNLGETAAPGEILATLESKEMAEAKANYLTALKRFQLAATTFEREKHLIEKNISSMQEFNDSESRREEAAIDLELSRQKLHTMGLDGVAIDQLPAQPSQSLRTYELHAPIAGKIISRHITPGELVTNDQEIYTIADLSSVWAEIHVFSQDRPFVKQGQKVTITANDGQSAEAIVLFLSPVIAQDTRTSKAVVKIDNPSEIWLPGAFVQAEFITDEVDLPLVVKKEAIQNIDGTDVVFVATPDGFTVRPVTKGRSDRDHCEVLSGLQHGEDYACKNTFLLKADLKKDEAEHMD